MLQFPTAAHPHLIPAHAPNGDEWYGAAPYITGFPWTKQEVAKYAHHFNIIQTPVDPWKYAHLARCIDVEFLAVRPNEVAAFCAQRNKLHGDATVYCSESTLADILTFDPKMDFRLFAADWDNDPHNRPTWHGMQAWAKQYNDPEGYEPCVLYAPKF